jgi:hypothetical protein
MRPPGHVCFLPCLGLRVESGPGVFARNLAVAQCTGSMRGVRSIVGLVIGGCFLFTVVFFMWCWSWVVVTLPRGSSFLGRRHQLL